jgi:hypothetical protein
MRFFLEDLFFPIIALMLARRRFLIASRPDLPANNRFMKAGPALKLDAFTTALRQFYGQCSGVKAGTSA